MDSGGLKEAWKHASDAAQIPMRKGMPTTSLCRELCKMAERIDLPFGFWTRVGRRKHGFNRIRQVASMCHHGMAHLRNLANTTEPSICGSDAALYQMILTTCSHHHHHHHLYHNCTGQRV